MYPLKVFHWLEDKEAAPVGGNFFAKINPATEEILAKVALGGKEEIEKAIRAGEKAYAVWSQTPLEKRAGILKKAALLIQERKNEIAEIVALESGKPKKHAVGETEAAAKCGLFLADQLREFQPLPLESAAPGRKVELIRKSAGLGLLITPFNNPLAGIAWKTFPALLCGNAVIVKAHRDTPYTPVWFGKVLKEAGLPAGVFSVLQGTGGEIGAPLAADSRIKFISLTGSVKTGQAVLKSAAGRLAKVCVEAGGKNPFVVCDDADLEKAAKLAAASAFVDAGQRCAAASRLIIFDSVYEKFKNLFLAEVDKMKVGAGEDDDYGAIINEVRLKEILADVQNAVRQGAKLLRGGKRFGERGYFIAPTVLENISPKDEISQKEIFGPVIVLYKVKDFEEAVRLANNSDLKLSGAIHTKDMKKAKEFIDRYVAGVVRVNGPTHGSEPNMPFGGVGLSGNGWREPGVKALDFYSDWKQVSVE